MDEKAILELTSEGLAYVDENANRQFIDFEVCNLRYVEQWKDPVRRSRFNEINSGRTEQELEAVINRLKASKEIGSRDVTTTSIAFHTDPPAHFTFSNREEYDRIVYLIRKAGWHLFDQT